jgi:hypothetical protein
MKENDSVVTPASESGISDNQLFYDSEGIVIAYFAALMKLNTHMEAQPKEWIESLQKSMREIIETIPQYLQTQMNISTDNFSKIRHQNILDTIVSIDQRHLVDFGVQLAARVNVNSYGLVSPSTDSMNQDEAIGFGLFPAIGLSINHSCYPNAYYTYSPRGYLEIRNILHSP